MKTYYWKNGLYFTGSVKCFRDWCKQFPKDMKLADFINCNLH
ncbi:hypothetical protein GGQ84_001060 [Desulfitispora alkaliphila]